MLLAKSYAKTMTPLGGIHEEIDPWSDGVNLQEGTSFPVSSLSREVRNFPRTNIAETKKGYEITMEVPGCAKNDIQLKVENGNLVVNGKIEEETEEEKNKVYHRFERRTGYFVRRFGLNGDIRENSITAKCEDGVLNIFLPKAEESSNSRIIRLQ